MPENAAATARTPIPRPVRLREVRGRGLLTDVWINSVGPLKFAIDTGAGTTLVSPRAAGAARLSVQSGSGRSIAGLSGKGVAVREATIRTVAVGDRDNVLPGSIDAVVTSSLPNDLDGVLDPTQAFSPLGYVIDIPRLELSAFDPHEAPLAAENAPGDGTVVPWLRERGSRRPFVQLDNGDRALIDTGSSLGLAIRDSARSDRRNISLARDIGGGQISTRRVRPTTVAIGSLMLRNIPTDLISGAEADAPVLIGLSALRPFRLAFDPVHRLIEIAPAERRR
ncbi:MAG TPA: retroviral-like aspartic protease family protein [Pyrinomonadaceae bacterium]|jgi:predicted aspartyl protease